MLSYLHHGNQGPDVGKYKSEFPSDFHHLYILQLQQRMNFVEISIAVFQKRWRGGGRHF